jgi:hypothetical protein
MLIEILKSRVDWCQEKAKSLGGGQKMIGKKIKLNSIDAEDRKGMPIDTERINSIEIEKKRLEEKKMKSSGDVSLREKITLEVLVR